MPDHRHHPTTPSQAVLTCLRCTLLAGLSALYAALRVRRCRLPRLLGWRPVGAPPCCSGAALPAWPPRGDAVQCPPWAGELLYDLGRLSSHFHAALGTMIMMLWNEVLTSTVTSTLREEPIIHFSQLRDLNASYAALCAARPNATRGVQWSSDLIEIAEGFKRIQDARFGRAVNFELPLTRRLLVLWNGARLHLLYLHHARGRAAAAAAGGHGGRSSGARVDVDLPPSLGRAWWVPPCRAVITELLKLLEASAA